MITELECAVAKIRNIFLLVLSVPLDAQIVDFHIHSMLELKKLFYVFSAISNCRSKTTCRKAKCNDVISDISQV